jgi:uncharacterized protein (DUF433 family)
MIEGCLRTNAAPQEVMAALEWIKQNIEVADGQPAGNLNLEDMAAKAQKRAEKPAREPIPLTPSKDEMEARARGYTPEDEALIIKMLREGASIASIADKFPKKGYQTIYSKVTQLKSSGRV